MNDDAIDLEELGKEEKCVSDSEKALTEVQDELTTFTNLHGTESKYQQTKAFPSFEMDRFNQLAEVLEPSDWDTFKVLFGMASKNIDGKKAYKHAINQAEKQYIIPKRQAELEAINANKPPEMVILGDCPALRCDGFHVDMGRGVFLLNEPAIPIIANAMSIRRNIKDMDSSINSIEIQYLNNSGDVKSIIAPAALVMDARQLTKLSNEGLNIHSSHAMDAGAYIDILCNLPENRLSIPTVDACSNMGWHGDCFVPYDDGLAYNTGIDNKPYARKYAALIDTDGTLEAQAAFLNDVREDIRLRFLMDFSMIGFILPYIKADIETGAVNIFGKTTKGKSTSAKVLASLFGNYRKGKLIEDFSTTPNGMMAHAEFMRTFPIIIDEFKKCKHPESVETDYIFPLVDGTGKSRATRVGGLKSMNPWKAPLIMIGENPVLTGNEQGGTHARVINIEVTDDEPFTHSVEEAEAWTKKANTNYGHIGRAILKYIKAHSDEIEAMYEALRDYLSENFGMYAARQLQNVALAMVIDEIWQQVVMPDKIDFNTSLLIPKCCTLTAKVDISARAWDYLMDSITQHRSNFIDKDCSYASEIWGIKDDKGILWFIQSVMKDILKSNGMSINAVAPDWIKDGRLIKPSHKDVRHKYVKQKSFKGGSTSWCYAINMEWQEPKNEPVTTPEEISF